MGEGEAAAKTGIIDVPRFVDHRGVLSVAQASDTLPFEVNRVFWISHVPAGAVRGGHAHKACHEFLVCLRGSLRCLVDDGGSEREFLLDHPSKGLYLPPMNWIAMKDFSEDALLLVIASHPFDDSDHIKQRETFHELRGGAVR